MGAIASQITSLTIVYSIVYSDADQREHQSSASLAFVRRIHRGQVNSPHKWPVMRIMFPFDDVIMWIKPDVWWMGTNRIIPLRTSTKSRMIWFKKIILNLSSETLPSLWRGKGVNKGRDLRLVSVLYPYVSRNETSQGFVWQWLDSFTASLHTRHGRHLPVVIAVQNDSQWTLINSGHSYHACDLIMPDSFQMRFPIVISNSQSYSGNTIPTSHMPWIVIHPPG